MVVFLTITSVGFGFSVHRLVNSPTKSALAAREPASATASAAAAPDSSAMKQSLVDLGCLERRLGGEKWTTSKTSVRLRGRFCNVSRRAMRGFKGVRITNLTNGFEGTTFLQGREPAFVTDDVKLQKGSNLIQIEWKDVADNSAKSWKAEIIGD